MEKLTSAQRRTRIAALKQELAELQDQEAQATGGATMEVVEACRVLKHQNKSNEAIKFYRGKTSCSLREAFDFIRDL